MLALLFRGVFLAGVVGWYSTGLWRMIDGYFKVQFKRYLEDEFQRNPKMRQDVSAYAAAVDKAASPLADEGRPPRQSPSQPRWFPPESCEPGGAGERPASFCPTGKAGSDASPPGIAETGAAREGGKEVAGRRRDAPPAFGEDGDVEPPDRGWGGRMAAGIIEPRRPSADPAPPPRPPAPGARARRPRPSSSPGDRLKIGARSERASRRALGETGGGRRLPTLTFARSDFESLARPYRGSVYDGDEDEEEEEDAGMPVEELPYKPAIAIYGLERLPEEEFCPLTLEEDPACEEARPWP